MEHFLLYAIGLSLVSFLGMLLTKPPVAKIIPPHADSDDGNLRSSESQVAPHQPSIIFNERISPLEAMRRLNQAALHPIYDSEEEFVIPHSISDYAQY